MISPTDTETMSSSSLADLIQEHEGEEFPFPPVPPQPPSPSSSGSDLTPPYLARSLPPQRSSTSSQRHHRHRADNESDYRKDGHDSSSARLMQRLASRSDRDLKHMRALLVSTNERLDAETRRADQAEQRVVDVLHRLREAHDATALARAEAFKAQQEVRLYQIQLEAAQREITRAQDIVDQLERDRVEAEQQAARDRSLARRYKQEFVLSRAREDGREEGYREGLERGRRLGAAEFRGARPTGRAQQPQPQPRRASPTESEDQEDEEDTERYERRAASAPIPNVQRVSPPPQPAPYRPRQVQSVPPRAPDFAPIADTLPVPRLTTPMNIPSPSHERPERPPSQPAPSEIELDRPRDPVPVPIYNAPHSPSHPPFEVLPDNYIPYAPDNDTRSIHLPPPHELSRPVSVMEPSPTPSEARLPPAEEIRPIPPPEPSSHVRSRSVAPPYEPSIRSRDYAYNGVPAGLQPANIVNSPQSKASTTISQLDMVRPPRYDRAYAREVERSMPQQYYREPPRDVRSREAPVVADASSSSGSSSRRPFFKRSNSSDYRGPLDRIFRRRAKDRRSPEDSGELHPPVPNITVESPSTETSRPTTPPKSPMTEPHLLSPEHATAELPSIVQNFLSTGSQANPSYDQRSPLPIPTYEQQVLPIPMREQGPLPIPVRSPSPLPIPMRDLGPLPIRPPEPVEVYSAHTPYLPIPPPKSPSPYEQAPVPSGVRYPSPPGRPKSRASTSRDAPVPPGGFPNNSAAHNDSGESFSSGSYKSRKTRRSTAGSYGGGRLSPISLGFGSTPFVPERA